MVLFLGNIFCSLRQNVSPGVPLWERGREGERESSRERAKGRAGERRRETGERDRQT